MLDPSTDWTSSSDRWVAAPPVVLNVTSLVTAGGRHLAVLNFWDQTPILAIDSDVDGFDVYFADVADTEQRIRPTCVVPSDVSAGGSFAVTGDRPRLFTFRGDADQEENVHPFGTFHLEIGIPDVSGTHTYSLEIFQPYVWNEADLAEILFAWTRFHSNGGTAARDRLDRATFEAFSARMIDALARQRFTIWREAEQPLDVQIRSLVDQSNAIVGFGRHAAGTGLSFKLTLRTFDQIAENSQIYDTDPGRDAFILKRPTVRIADDLVANRAKFAYGRGQNVRGVNNEDNYSSATSSPISPPEAENTLVQEDAAAIAATGLRHVDLPDRVFANSEQWAEGDLEILRWSSITKEIEFSIGPLHFDFDVGDVIHVADAILGLSGTEDFVVTEKTYGWDLLNATVKAVRVDRSIAVSKTPAEITSGPELVGWWSGDFGHAIIPLTLQLDQWTNRAVALGSPAPNMVQPPRGTATPAEVLLNYRNGRDAVSFLKGAILARAMAWDWTSGEESWTFLVCGEFHRTTTIQQLLVGAAGGASGRLSLSVTNSIDGRAKFDDGVESSGPVIADGHSGILIWQLYRTRGNYVRAGDERSFCVWIDFDDPSQSATFDDPKTVAYPYVNTLAQPFGEPGSGTADVKLRGFAGQTGIGCNSGLVGNVNSLNAVLFELIVFRHKRGIRPLRTSELRGLVNFCRGKWQ